MPTDPDSDIVDVAAVDFRGADEPPPPGWRRWLERGEEGLANLALVLVVLLPLAEIVARLFGTGVPGSEPLTRHLTLWVAFLGAALAAREGKLLALATGTFLPEGRWRVSADVFAATVGAGLSALLAAASWELVQVEREFEGTFALGIPTWIAQIVLPLSFGLIALRVAWRASSGWVGRTFGFAGIATGLAIAHYAEALAEKPAWPALAVVIAATAVGGPIFAALGGAAVLLFVSDWVPIATVPAATYDLSVSPFLAAIPLFTVAGFLLAEGQASHRIVRLFRALFGWIPGGTAVVAAVVCGFFTVFTGGSGVTILALGGLLFKALQEESYNERFSLGLLTASGSLGLLIPPALPLILYGIVADLDIQQLFVAGLVPGFLLIALVAGWGVREGIVAKVPRQRYSWAEARGAMWEAKWELVLPLVVLVPFFAGYATLVETAAVTALYTFVTQTFVHRDIKSFRQLFETLTECVVLLGGVLIILGVAVGLTSYLVDAQVPMLILDWVQAHISSKLVFLLCLNVLLLVIGCMMDIFSAIVVVVPLLVPLGAAFEIHPVHLAIIFIANLELGYLTPPVGLNLFLASYRFDRPLMEIYRASVPYLVLRGLGVLVVTYVPWLSTFLISGP